jgi:hypothetical protein
MNVRAETRYNKAVSILRGPLYYSLRIGERYIKLKSHHDTLPVIDWEIQPTTPWNYGLVIDRRDPGRSIVVETGKVSTIPFSSKDAPVVLKAKGRAIPEWKMAHNSADDPPVSPVASDQPVTELELIPYGCTRLRITEFPVVADKR